MEKLVAAEPRNVSWSRDLMLAYGHVADVLGNPAMQNLGDREAALHVYQQAADIGKRLYIADPADQRAAADFGIVLSRVETAMDDTISPQGSRSSASRSRYLNERRRSARATCRSRFTDRRSMSIWAIHPPPSATRSRRARPTRSPRRFQSRTCRWAAPHR